MLQNKFEGMNSSVLVEMSKLIESFPILEVKLSVTKHVNFFLSSKEREYWLNTQYYRRKCLDIVGIPGEMEADALEEKVIVTF